MKVRFEWGDNDPRVAALMDHFRKVGNPFRDESALFKDIVDDAIDVWYDDHLGSEDSCEDDREPADSVLAEDRAVAEDIRREMTIDEYRS